jgi:hypothetical protein
MPFVAMTPPAREGGLPSLARIGGHDPGPEASARLKLLYGGLRLVCPVCYREHRPESRHRRLSDRELCDLAGCDWSRIPKHLEVGFVSGARDSHTGLLRRACFRHRPSGENDAKRPCALRNARSDEHDGILDSLLNSHEQWMLGFVPEAQRERSFVSLAPTRTSKRGSGYRIPDASAFAAAPGVPLSTAKLEHDTVGYTGPGVNCYAPSACFELQLSPLPVEQIAPRVGELEAAFPAVTWLTTKDRLRRMNGLRRYLQDKGQSLWVIDFDENGQMQRPHKARPLPAPTGDTGRGSASLDRPLLVRRLVYLGWGEREAAMKVAQLRRLCAASQGTQGDLLHKLAHINLDYTCRVALLHPYYTTDEALMHANRIYDPLEGLLDGYDGIGSASQPGVNAVRRLVTATDIRMADSGYFLRPQLEAATQRMFRRPKRIGPSDLPMVFDGGSGSGEAWDMAWAGPWRDAIQAINASVTSNSDRSVRIKNRIFLEAAHGITDSWGTPEAIAKTIGAELGLSL